MGEQVAAVHGWVDADQLGYHERVFAPGRWQIITVDGADAGNLVVELRPDEVYLGRIELHPDHQGRGVGAHVVRTVLDTAAAREQPLLLDVFTVNTRARAFYERLGFREVARHGLNGFKVTMRHAPPASRM
jgi:ribosomal protein S18 acetylase RimI-like enzyme